MRVVDLTCDLYNGMPTYPGDPPFRHEFVRHGKSVGDVTLSRLEAGSHSGTHIDAPLHFVPRGRSVDMIDPQDLVLPVSFVDLSYKAPGSRITADDLRGRVLPGTAVALYTGFSRLRGKEEYLYKWPFLDRSAADLLASVGVKAVITEGMSISGWPGAEGFPWPPLTSEEESTYVHVKLLSSGIIIVEGACGLDQLAGCGSPTVVISPLKVRGSEGAMARVLGLC